MHWIDLVGLAVFPFSLILTMILVNFSQVEADWSGDVYYYNILNVTIGVFHLWLWLTGLFLYFIKKFQNVKLMLVQDFLFGISRAQFLMAIWVILLLIFTSVYWNNTTFAPDWALSVTFCLNNTADCNAEKLGQQTGRLAEVLIGLVLIPVSRNSVLDRMFDLSYVNAIAFHRVIAMVFVIGTLIHGISYVDSAFLTQDLESWQSDLFNMYDAQIAEEFSAVNLSYKSWGNGMYMEEMGVISVLFMIPAAFFSHYYFRRRCYNVFYAFHMLFHVMLVFAWLHVVSVFYYSIPGITLYLIDVGIRLFSRFKHGVYVVSAKMEVGGKTRVDLDVKNRPELQKFQPESFVRICLPAITGWEWHPFTLIKTKTPSIISILVSVESPVPNEMNWCKSFSNHVLNNKSAVIAIEGPFSGASRSDKTFSNGPILFLVAGSGITPALGVICEDVHAHVLTWSVRLCPNEPIGSSSTMSFLGEIPNTVDVVLYETRAFISTSADDRLQQTNIKNAVDDQIVDPSMDDITSTTVACKQNNIEIRSNRINFSKTYSTYLLRKGNPISNIFISGPPKFTADALRSLQQFQVEFHCSNTNKMNIIVASFEL